MAPVVNKAKKKKKIGDVDAIKNAWRVANGTSS